MRNPDRKSKTRRFVRQLVAQGYTEAAIADIMHMSIEHVSLITGAASETGTAPSERRQQDHDSEFLDQYARAKETAAEAIGRATLERLARQREEQQAEALALRAEIERLAMADQGPARGRAGRILRQLEHPPALRTVQWHLKEIASARE